MTQIQPLDIVVVGSAHMDIVVWIARRPQLGETVTGDSWRLQVGGKGANQALQAAIQGARVAMVGRTGDDQFGDGLREGLSSHGVDVSHLVVDRTAASGMGIGLIGRDGVPQGVTVGGVNARIGSEDIERAACLFAGAKCLLLQQEIPAQANLAAARMAKSKGVRVILNAAPARDVPADLATLVDVLVVNEVEAATLSARDAVSSREAAIDAAAALNLSYATVLLTLGGNGVVIAAQKRKPIHLPAYAVEAVDALGAGDSFIGGLAARLAKGDDIVAAAAYANAVGALAVTRPGLTGPHLAPDRVAALLRASPERAP